MLKRENEAATHVGLFVRNRWILACAHEFVLCVLCFAYCALRAMGSVLHCATFALLATPLRATILRVTLLCLVRF